jgi:hypothetical protein
MTAIPEATDGRLPPCAPTKAGSGLALATPATRGSTNGGQLTVPLHRFSNPDRNHKTTMLAAAPPATVPVKVGRATFDYASLEPDDAAFLRGRAASIRQEVKSTVEAVYQIGVDLYGAKLRLGHGQFIEWVEAECGFSLRTAQNYVRASAFAADKFATVANLPPATVYRLSAKSAPPEVVKDVLARAARGESISDAEVTRMFRAAKGAPGCNGTQDKGRRVGPQHEGPSPARAEAKYEIAKANARAIMKEFGRNGAILLLGIRDNIVETLTFLEQEINGSDGPHQRGAA